MAVTAMESQPSACPRWATKRTPGRPTVGPQIFEQARQLGFVMMPWQEQVAMVAGELLPDPENPHLWVPAYRDVGIYVPRQSGKTTYILSKMFQRARGWVDQRGPQRIAYTAQTGNDARKKLVEDWVPIIAPRRAKLGVSRILTGMGNEGVVFRNGSRTVLLASTAEAGHGKTIDEAFKDEFFADTDDRRDQALGPAMITKAAAQTTTTSTAGTEDSVPLNALVERGRAAVEADRREGVAFFEWSAEPDADPDDPATWWSCMPALGFTQTEAAVRLERERMKDGEFRRAFLNQPTKSDDRVIPVGSWAAVCSSHLAPLSAGAVFGLDMNPERTATSIAGATGGSIPTVELVEYIEHSSPVERCRQLAANHGAVFVIDKSGPAGSLIATLVEEGVTVVEFGPRDVVAACGEFYDRVMQARVTVRTHPRLDLAAAAAVRRPVGDAWVWGRKRAQGDVSPLMAATLAIRAAAVPLGESVYEERGLVTL